MGGEHRTITGVACTVCGCVCDDLQLDVEEERIKEVRGACSLAEPWLLALNDCRPPPASIDGSDASYDTAVRHAASLLHDSDNPLIFGLSRSSTGGQRAAVQLAEWIGANIDTTASACHGPSIMALQNAGEVTCSLGEVRRRADLVLFWGADPVRTHPRHFERYSVDPTGRFVPRGREDRTLVVIDTLPTATSEQADLFLQVQPETDFDLIGALHQIIRGMDPPRSMDSGIPLDSIRDLARRMMDCRYGVVFFGLGLARSGQGHLSVEALLRLVADLNHHTRFNARRLRLPGNVSGADTVLCWHTGYPFAVNFARAYPRYNPGEYSADELLARRDTDCCLVVGSESVELLSAAARATLREIPTIVLDYPHANASWEPTVRLTTAVYGVHVAGTAYRMDDVPIPLRRVIDCEYATDESVLRELLDRLSE